MVCTPKDKAEAVAEWALLEPEREAQRKTRGIWEVKEHELTSYNKTLAAAIEKHAPPKVPAMAVTSMMLTLQEVRLDPELLKDKSQGQRRRMIARHNKEQKLKNHVDKISNSLGSEAYWAMIHHEISIPEAMNNKDGKAAMLKEWAKLEEPEGRPAAWDVKLVESKATVMQRGRDNKIVYHFRSIK